MDKFYYLHLWACAEYYLKNAQEEGSMESSRKEGELTLEIDDWPADDLFDAWPIVVAAERLKGLMNSFGWSAKLKFKRLGKICTGANFKSNYPDALLPTHYWQVDFSGIPGQDDFGIWENKYLVVSERALSFLRDHHVIHAEADIINLKLVDYFESGRKYFWMNEDMKKYFQAL
jgi:hypothetical protein